MKKLCAVIGNPQDQYDNSELHITQAPSIDGIN